MDIVYHRGKATAAEVQENLPEPPGYSAVRALLAILVEKGHLKIESDGPRHVYLPVKARQQVARNALKQVTEVFFGGSVEQTVAALLDGNSPKLSDEELKRIQEMIEQARKQGR